MVDKYGLPIESQGTLDKAQSGLMSSIMKNAARLHALLVNPAVGDEGTAKKSSDAHADCMAHIQFSKENLIIRNKQGITLAIRQAASE